MRWSSCASGSWHIERNVSTTAFAHSSNFIALGKPSTDNNGPRTGAIELAIATDGLLAAGAAMPHPCCADGRSRMARSAAETGGSLLGELQDDLFLGHDIAGGASSGGRADLPPRYRAGRPRSARAWLRPAPICLEVLLSVARACKRAANKVNLHSVNA